MRGNRLSLIFVYHILKSLCRYISCFNFPQLQHFLSPTFLLPVLCLTVVPHRHSISDKSLWPAPFARLLELACIQSPFFTHCCDHAFSSPVGFDRSSFCQGIPFCGQISCENLPPQSKSVMSEDDPSRSVIRSARVSEALLTHSPPLLSTWSLRVIIV